KEGAEFKGSATSLDKCRFNRILFILFFAILNHWSTQIGDAYSQASSENDAADPDKRHFGSAGKRISRQGDERRGVAGCGKYIPSDPDCFTLAGIRLHLARSRVFAGIFPRPYVATDVGRL